MDAVKKFIVSILLVYSPFELHSIGELYYVLTVSLSDGPIRAGHCVI